MLEVVGVFWSMGVERESDERRCPGAERVGSTIYGSQKFEN